MTTRTAVELVTGAYHSATGDVEPWHGGIEDEAAALDARLSALEAFAEEMRKAHAEAFSFEHWAAWISDALAKLPVKP